jgi:hypothetical protein
MVHTALSKSMTASLVASKVTGEIDTDIYKEREQYKKFKHG